MMAVTRGVVQGLAVARLKDQIVVASFLQRGSYQDIPQFVRQQAKAKLVLQPAVPKKIMAQGCAWHVVQDEDGRTYILVTDEYYTDGGALECLKAVKDQFVPLFGPKSLTTKTPGKFNAQCEEMLAEIAYKHDQRKLHEPKRGSDLLSKIKGGMDKDARQRYDTVKTEASQVPYHRQKDPTCSRRTAIALSTLFAFALLAFGLYEARRHGWEMQWTTPWNWGGVVGTDDSTVHSAATTGE